MAGETNLLKLLQSLSPHLNEGEYVFTTVDEVGNIPGKQVLGVFREPEGTTIILKKEIADQLNLNYDFIAAWITLNVHSALQAVGLTAAFSNALANEGVSCNVIAGYYHDHIFVEKGDAQKAMKILTMLSQKHQP